MAAETVPYSVGCLEEAYHSTTQAGTIEANFGEADSKENIERSTQYMAEQLCLALPPG
jgi:hypothetical protein